MPAVEIPPATDAAVLDPPARRSWVPRPRLSGMIAGPAGDAEPPIVTSRAQAVERARELGLLESPAYD